MSSAPATIDEYLAAAPAQARKMLEELRAIIQDAAPEAVETISYQVPTYKLFGSLVSFGAAKNHCSFYVMSGSTLDRFKEELKGLDTSKGTVRIPFGDPVPVSLIRKLVAARIEENEAGAVQSAKR